MTQAEIEIRKIWRIIAIGEDSVLELRALWPRAIGGPRPPVTRHFFAAKHEDLQGLKAAFEVAALALNASGYNVYTVMNPIRADFKGPGCAKDSDIRFRDLLLIDIDRLEDTSQPASQEELDAADALATVVDKALDAEGWGTPIRVMSGNGVHLYYVMAELPNDEDAAVLVRTTLKNLATTFNTDKVGIDITVHNASRITKVPGTIMRKGLETEERPYRMARVVGQ